MKPPCPRLAVPALLAAGVAAAAAAPATYTTTPTHTFLRFEFDTGLSTQRGRFNRVRGEIEIDREARRGRAEATVDPDSVDTGVPALDRALRSALAGADGRPPRFEAAAFAFDGERIAAVDGTLTLRGSSAPLRWQALRFGCYTHPLLRREVCGGDFEATLQPSAFGIAPGTLPGGDRLRLVLQVEAVRR